MSREHLVETLSVSQAKKYALNTGVMNFENLRNCEKGALDQLSIVNKTSPFSDVVLGLNFRVTKENVKEVLLINSNGLRLRGKIDEDAIMPLLLANNCSTAFHDLGIVFLEDAANCVINYLTSNSIMFDEIKDCAKEYFDRVLEKSYFVFRDNVKCVTHATDINYDKANFLLPRDESLDILLLDFINDMLRKPRHPSILANYGRHIKGSLSLEIDDELLEVVLDLTPDAKTKEDKFKVAERLAKIIVRKMVPVVNKHLIDKRFMDEKVADQLTCGLPACEIIARINNNVSFIHPAGITSKEQLLEDINKFKGEIDASLLKNKTLIHLAKTIKNLFEAASSDYHSKTTILSKIIIPVYVTLNSNSSWFDNRLMDDVLDIVNDNLYINNSHTIIGDLDVSRKLIAGCENKIIEESAALELKSIGGVDLSNIHNFKGIKLIVSQANLDTISDSGVTNLIARLRTNMGNHRFLNEFVTPECIISATYFSKIRKGLIPAIIESVSGGKFSDDGSLILDVIEHKKCIDASVEDASIPSADLGYLKDWECNTNDVKFTLKINRSCKFDTSDINAIFELHKRVSLLEKENPVVEVFAKALSIILGLQRFNMLYQYDYSDPIVALGNDSEGYPIVGYFGTYGRETYSNLNPIVSVNRRQERLMNVELNIDMFGPDVANCTTLGRMRGTAKVPATV